jgi:hypothetical protein
MESENPKPSKVVKSEPQGSSDSSREDNLEARRDFDSRLYSGVSLSNETEHYRLFRYFDFDGQDNKTNEKIKDVYWWAKQGTESGDMFDITRKLSELDRELGQPDMGVSRLNHFWNYINIQNQIKRLEDERIQRYGR